MTAAIHEIHESKSATSYKSTHSSRSSVLERAREYSRKIDEESKRRAKSLERQSDISNQSGTPRSHSAGRVSAQGNRTSTRERAMASVQHEASSSRQPMNESPRSPRATPSSGIEASRYSGHRRPQPTTPRTPASTSKSNRTNGDHTVSTMRSQNTGASKSRPSPSRSMRSRNQDEPQEAVVTPELLVDALSGHEDGLLAIAEKLMEHYDSGYDVMGEAIIDAFADVQKLFQHVVEAAHMEGAAFEASRREEEMQEMRKQAAEGQLVALDDGGPNTPMAPSNSPSGPTRHDEFIDQDVKDCLTEAIRKGSSLRDANKHAECYQLFENACQSASALLPVDSDHRGRLQLSIARAESMSPDRACAILRYAMDDVLRSGLRAVRTQLPDPSKRADVVLSKPKAHPSTNGLTGQAGVVQSSEEALASLVEEMKEVLGAPVYNNTPLQDVAKRFWNALGDAQKSQLKNEERLEQSLGKLKGDFLLARAEWEEKLTSSQEAAEQYKKKYMRLKEGGRYMEEARNMSQRLGTSNDEGETINGNFDSSRSYKSRGGVESVASLGSGLAQHARSLVGSFACSGINERTGGVLAAELAEHRQDGKDGDMRYDGDTEWRDKRRNNTERRFNRSHATPPHERKDHDRSYHSHAASASSGSRGPSAHSSSRYPRSQGKPQGSRSFRDYQQSPQRVDI